MDKPASEAEIAETPSKLEESRTMYPQLTAYIESLVADMAAIPQERRDSLKKIALYVQTKKQSNEAANLHLSARIIAAGAT